MRNLLILFTCILALCAVSHSQPPTDPTCPTVNVAGMTDNFKPRESIQYSASIDLKGWAGTIEYRWSASWRNPSTLQIVSPPIAEGQGTPNIKIPRPEPGVTAKLVVIGFPDGCPNTASETVSWDWPPDPIKLAKIQEVSGANRTAKFGGIARRVRDNPDARLFVIFGHRKDTLQSAIKVSERRVIEALAAAGVDTVAVTFRIEESESEVIQFWLVPRGARDPICDECRLPEKPVAAPACPIISVLGPAGVTPPGESMQFTAQVSGDVPANAVRSWKVEGGEIVRGQGTAVLHARGPKNTTSYNITATLEILGLPEGCPSSASETAGVTCMCTPILLDQYNKVLWNKEKGRLAAALVKAKKLSESRIFVLKYFMGDDPRNQRSS